MSSEGTMSVVGSEVMPLDYGSIDSESSPSPTSLERTVEERREQRLVEEEEDEMPSNILEAGSGVDGCYDLYLEIVSELRGYVSELSSKDSLRGLVGNCNLPHHVLIRPIGVNERACSVPRDHLMPLYVHYLIARLRFPIPELLVGLLLDYSIEITQLTPNAIRAGGKGEKGWYYFGPRSSNKENRSLFSAGPSSIKGWKEKFFFVDDTEWSIRDAEVEQLSAWKAKKPSRTTITEMDEFINVARGLRIPKKPRKKSKTSTTIKKGVAERERLSSTSARALEVQLRPEPVMGGSEDASEEVASLQRKKRKVAEQEAREDEVVEFVPRPSPPEIDPEKSLFEATNTTGAKRFLNATLLEVDKRQARDQVVSQLRATVVRHALESASWTNTLAQEYVESKEKEEWEKEKKEMQRRLDEVLPSVTELQNDNDVLSTKLVLEERKRKIYEEKLELQDKYIDNMRKGAVKLKKNLNLLVHNGMEEHIGNFLNSSTFENILKLYRLPTAIVAFTDCRKKVKAQYAEVDVTMVTFGEQEEGMEEDGESLSADFRPLIKLRWEHDVEGRTIFPPAFDAELVAVEEEGEEEEEAQGVGVEDQAALAVVQPPEVHPVSSDEVQQLAPPKAEVPPLPAGDEPIQPPLPVEEQPPPLAE
ncbi:hypothetical protein SLEP1_g12456 [Rubroshorea leprosula]|uniref:Transposase (Putative), gypsy type n=1 Tax=Rubroshorea leprosula TaxID=152421 RepID=A0AAV5ICK5_9ROSI|nr:hypothetical protein SLEP1_g12456 [Rubroshorea leprosula]